MSKKVQVAVDWRLTSIGILQHLRFGLCALHCAELSATIQVADHTRGVARIFVRRGPNFQGPKFTPSKNGSH